MAASGKTSPQAIVALDSLADGRHLRLVGPYCCREDPLDTVIVNPRCKTVEVSSSGRRIAAHSCALVLRKKPKADLPACRGLSLSISFAIAITANLSALSNVTAKRRIASCQARIVLACQSTPWTLKLIYDGCETWRAGSFRRRGMASFRSGTPDPRRRSARLRLQPRLSLPHPVQQWAGACSVA